MLRIILIALFLLFSVRAYSQETDSIVDLSKITFNVDKADFKTLLDSSYLYSNTNPKLAIFFGLKALDKMPGNTDIYHKGKLLVTLGRSYHDLGDYPKAINYYFEELTLYHNNNGQYDKFIISTYINLGEAYRAVVDFKAALLHLNNALNLINKTGFSQHLSFALDRLSSVYFEIGTNNNDTSAILKAISYADSSLKLSRLEKDTGLICSNLNVIGACNTYLGNYKIAIKNYSEAESYYPRDEINRSNLLNNIANAYYILDDMDNAIKYAKESYDLAKPKGILIYLREATATLNRAHRKKGNYELALFYLEENSGYSFQLFNDENKNKLVAAERKYESEKNKKLFEDEKKNKLYLISLLALFAISGFTAFYLRQRYYKKQNFLLNELNQTKSKFISILSHDLRSPLTGINGLLEVLHTDYDSFSDEEKKDFISSVLDSTKNLYSLIENLLQWSKLQQGRYELTPETLNLAEIVNKVTALQKINAINKKIKIETRVNPEIKIKADENFLNTIIRNLLDNAIKYSNEGASVTIAAAQKNSCVEISVSDTGIGMDNETLSKLFKIEEHIRTKGTLDETGSGLGLLLVKEMVEKSGGSITAASQPHTGSTFTFTIPAA
jgi:anti-sigma regulatory factor (Ser/Thr protein kinase)